MTPRLTPRTKSFRALLASILPLTLLACGDDVDDTTTIHKPLAPTALNAQVVAGAVKLTWKDNSSDEDGFLIMKKEDEGAYVELPMTAANATEFQDTAVTAGKMYMYMVHAKHGTEVSDASNEAMAMP
ncbi:MAG: fibronectin type III domain-containing protein [Deltaproteobacteria bacterium]|nr:fibronectin type III domain-containing protein [Deltaproteobacteria bacterium]